MLKDKPDDPLPKPVIRPYTPVSDPATKGHLDLVIKVSVWRPLTELLLDKSPQLLHSPSIEWVATV